MPNPRTLLLYGVLTLATLGWWFAAFHTSHKILNEDFIAQNDGIYKSCEALDCLSPLHRHELHQALSGDFSLMQTLISAWDIDAQILQARGMLSVARLPQDRFLRSQELGRRIYKGAGQVKNLRELKFLPQTYVSASFLMAIVPSRQIVAIPKGLRKLTQIYSSAVMEQIPYDIDRYHTEILFQAHPDIAFVAHYSDPATVQTLQDQGIHLIFLKNIDSLEGIQEELKTTGNAAQAPLETELLSLFIEAALMNMDNRVLVMKGKEIPKILCLDYFEQFALPTQKTLKGKLLLRLGINASLNTAVDAWSLPFTREELIAQNPAAMIISAPNGSSLKEQILREPSLSQIDAIKNGRIYTVDEALQDSPSQYLVLAYYDLFRIMERVLRS